MNIATFCAAVEAGDVATVRKLALAQPGLVNAHREGGFGERTALHYAVLRRDMNMTRLLMELGGDARAGIWPHRDATTAHTIASDRGYAEIVAIIEQEELRKRKQLSSPNATIGPKTDEIHRAILEGRCDEARRMLQDDLSLAGASNLRGATPLHVAARVQETSMIEWLLERQVLVDAKDGEGHTPLDYAAFAAGWSAHGRDFSFMENSGKDPSRFHETIRLLLSNGAELTPRAAVAIGEREAILQMHREGRLKNEIDIFRGGLLAIAVRVNRIDMVSLLLDLGLDPDESVTAGDVEHRSWGMPLWFTAMCGRDEIAALLLARGADVNGIVYACGDSLSTANRTGDEKMQALLLEHGARLTVEHVAGDMDRKTAQGILDGTIRAHSLNVDQPTPTDLAEQMLWAAGCCDPEIVRICLPRMTRKPDDPWWNYVLIHATLPDNLKLILDHGVDPDVTGSGGFTILHHLATNYAEEETRIARATILLDAGASLDKRDPLLGSTPLGWACRWGRIALVDLYLARGTDAIESDAEPWATPLAWAAKGGHSEIADRLRSHGAR